MILGNKIQKTKNNSGIIGQFNQATAIKILTVATYN